MQWFGLVVVIISFEATFPSTVFENKLMLKAFESKPGRNVVIASLPIQWSLCKLASIATGKARSQLVNALGMDVTEIKKCFSTVSEMFNKLAESDLILFNKIFVNYSEEMDTKFFTDSYNSFGVGVESVGFSTPAAAVQFINNKVDDMALLGIQRIQTIPNLLFCIGAKSWNMLMPSMEYLCLNRVATVTYRRVKDILFEDDITEETKIMLLSAAYLKPSWISFPFDVSKTKPKKFYHMNGLVSDVPMMVRQDFYDVEENQLGTIITLPLKMASMTFVLPKTPKDLPRVLNELKKNPTTMRTSWTRVKNEPRKLMLPRFKIKADFDLTDILKRCDVNEILDSNSTGLNAILKEQYRKRSNLYVNRVKQKVFLEVDEYGSSRTDIPLSFEREFPSNMVKDVVLDRPFYFTVDFDEVTQLVKRGVSVVHHALLHGVYYGPE